MQSVYPPLARAGNKVSRRRLLRASAAAGVLASISGTAACSSGSKSRQSAANPAAPAVADSTKGKPGGTFKFMLAAFPASFAVTESINSYNQVGYFYSALLAQAWGQDSVKPDAFTQLEPDLAQAMPEQPDQTTYVFKLRPNVRFHNGRTLTADDVKYSFDRWATYEKSVYRTTWQTWYDHTEVPDPQTVVVKAKIPYVDGLVTLGGNTTAYIMAREFEESPDATKKQMGTGPFLWAGAQPPVSITLHKNPDYFLKPYPYFDEILLLATTDPIARITNFITKQVHMPWLVYAQERDQIRQQRPDAKIEEFTSWPQGVFMRTDKPPFNDKRVRQALSMAVDRKKIREGVNKREGRDDQYFNVMYKSLFGTREVSELGGAARYWKYDPQTAKQLLAAAGVTLPIQTQMYHWDPSVVGPWLADMATLTQATWRELGIAEVKDIQQPAAQFSNGANIGQYDGMGLAITTGLNSKAPAYALEIRDKWSWGPNGEHSPSNNCYVNDRQLSQLAAKQLGQFNANERAQTLKQMEEIIAEQQYLIVYSSTTQSWLWDPSLRNVSLSVEQGSRRYMMKWWFA